MGLIPTGREPTSLAIVAWRTLYVLAMARQLDHAAGAQMLAGC